MNKIITVSALTLLMTACTQTPTQSISQETLNGTWLIKSVNNVAAVNSASAKFTFNGDKTNGNTGCNGFFGSYTLDGNTITFGPMGATKKMCMGEEMAQEDALFKILGAPLSINIDGKTASFTNKGAAVLVLEKE